MASTMDRLYEAVLAQKDAPVFYFAGGDEAPLEEATLATRRMLVENGAEADVIRFDGPAPNLGEVIAACGALSFFGNRRIVELRHLVPTTVRDKDAEELAALFGEVSSAVLIISAVYKDKKAATSKKAKALYAAAQKAGYAATLAPFTRKDHVLFAVAAAEKLGAHFSPGAAQLLVERAGESRPLLAHEVEKLAAAAGYGAISTGIVEALSTRNIEADVFELARLITTGNTAAAQGKLADLIALRHEPVAISAALAGSFVDMYRALLGAATRRGTAAVAKDFGTYGGEWRLQKAQQSAARYGTARLEEGILALYRLDMDLKSSALADKSVLLQATLSQLAALGGA